MATMSPHLVVDDAASAIDYVKAFDAVRDVKGVVPIANDPPHCINGFDAQHYTDVPAAGGNPPR